MGDLADVYEETRGELCKLVAGLPEGELTRPVPATPGWGIRDLISHLAGDASCVKVGDFPREFFQAFGDDAAVVGLNEWTAGHIAHRAEWSISEILDEWGESAATLVDMMRGDAPWPSDVPPFADRVLITDLGVHQHDIYGALGIDRDREGPPVRIGLAGYVTILDMRLSSDGVPSLHIEAGEKSWVVGGEDAATALRCGRFELFRALSGRRSPDQLRAYDWDGDPEPFIGYFYPYGVRTEALVE
jgi:uncharacterized protein (TIGR03083 family)